MNLFNKKNSKTRKDNLYIITITDSVILNSTVPIGQRKQRIKDKRSKRKRKGRRRKKKSKELCVINCAGNHNHIKCQVVTLGHTVKITNGCSAKTALKRAVDIVSLAVPVT
jgi:hypothetical protein